MKYSAKERQIQRNVARHSSAPLKGAASCRFSVITLSRHWPTSHATMPMSDAPANHAFALRSTHHRSQFQATIRYAHPYQHRSPRARTRSAPILESARSDAACAGTACPTIVQSHSHGPSRLLGPWSLTSEAAGWLLLDGCQTQSTPSVRGSEAVL